MTYSWDEEIRHDPNYAVSRREAAEIDRRQFDGWKDEQRRMDEERAAKEAARLERRYWVAVGWALQYGVRVHRGPDMKSLGELEDEVLEERARRGESGAAAELAGRKAFEAAYADSESRWRRC